MYVCMHVCMYNYMQASMYVHMYICILHICVYVCVYVYIYLGLCICVCRVGMRASDQPCISRFEPSTDSVRSMYSSYMSLLEGAGGRNLEQNCGFGMDVNPRPLD